MLRTLLALTALVLATFLYVSTPGDGGAAGPPVVPTALTPDPEPASAHGELVTLPSKTTEREPIQADPAEATPGLESPPDGPGFDLMTASVEELVAERNRLKDLLDELVTPQTYRDLVAQGRGKVLGSVTTKDLLNSSGKVAPNQVRMDPEGMLVLVLEEEEFPEACKAFRDKKAISKRIAELVDG